jgi:hypothetical protein
MISLDFLKSHKAETAPSLKPPAEWWEKKVAEVKRSNPDYSDEQVRATVGSIWYKQMSKNQRKKRREDEGKKYGKAPVEKSVLSGVSFDMLKATIYQAIDKESFEREPAVVVDCFDKDGKFEEQKVCTIPMVLEEPEEYDNRTFWILLEGLSRSWMGDEAKRAELAGRLVEELSDNIEEEKKAQEKLGELKADETRESNWEKKKRFFFGKSVLWLPSGVNGEVEQRMEKAISVTSKRKKAKDSANTAVVAAQASTDGDGSGSPALQVTDTATVPA